MNVIFLTHEPLGPSKSGTSARIFELAHYLAATFTTYICYLSRPDSSGAFYRIYSKDLDRHPQLLSRDEGFTVGRSAAAICVIQSSAQATLWLRSRSKAETYVVVDLYCFYWFENLIASLHEPRIRTLQYQLDISRLTENLLLADHFLVATDKQRSYTIGLLTLLGIANITSLHEDPTLTSLISTVPFGIPDEPPPPEEGSVLSFLPGVPRSAKVLVWGGGIHDWLDADVLIRAMERLKHAHSNIVLLFASARSHPQRGHSRQATRALNMARHAGLLNHTVFFNDTWVPYNTRYSYLMGATFGVVTHQHHVETEYSFRTRVLDYLWAGLPLVTTTGDYFAQQAHIHQFGLTARPNDSLDLAQNILLMTYNSSFYKGNIRQFRQSLFWSKVAEPLRLYCLNPRRETRSQISSPLQATWLTKHQYRFYLAVALLRDRRFAYLFSLAAQRVASLNKTAR